MFSPTSSSGTEWIAPPDARAVATARSPSAGLPIASERAAVCGRTGVTGRPRGRRRRPGRSPAPGRRSAAAPRPRRARARGARRSPGRASRTALPTRSGDDHVRELPAELLGDLERERLRALRVVGAQADVDERPRQLERELDGQPAAVVVGAAAPRRSSRRRPRSRSASRARARRGRRPRPRALRRRRARRRR